MEDREIRAALDRHWAASDANDLEGEHQIYREDAVLEYPQSGERIRGRRKIQSSRAAQPNRKRFAVRRMIGAGDLWVTEYVLTYDGRPSMGRADALNLAAVRMAICRSLARGCRLIRSLSPAISLARYWCASCPKASPAVVLLRPRRMSWATPLAMPTGG